MRQLFFLLFLCLTEANGGCALLRRTARRGTCLWLLLFGHNHVRAVLFGGNLTGLVCKHVNRKVMQGVDAPLLLCIRAACSGGIPALLPHLTRLCFVFSPCSIMAWWRWWGGFRARLVPLPATCGIQGQLKHFSLWWFYCVYSNLWSVDRLDHTMLPPL